MTALLLYCSLSGLRQKLANIAVPFGRARSHASAGALRSDPAEPPNHDPNSSAEDNASASAPTSAIRRCVYSTPNRGVWVSRITASSCFLKFARHNLVGVYYRFIRVELAQQFQMQFPNAKLDRRGITAQGVRQLFRAGTAQALVAPFCVPHRIGFSFRQRVSACGGHSRRTGR